ncbi:MAG TPA: hypothetical protein VF105_05000 [Gemmatimonadaceae bacterium]
MSVAIACGSDDPISPIAAASGSYTLQTVNGVLPFRIYHTDASGETTFDLVSGGRITYTDPLFSDVSGGITAIYAK